jgi:hypothetical protein
MLMRQVCVDGKEEQLCNVAALFIIGTGSTNTKLTDLITSINKVLLISPNRQVSFEKVLNHHQ